MEYAHQKNFKSSETQKQPEYPATEKWRDKHRGFSQGGHTEVTASADVPTHKNLFLQKNHEDTSQKILKNVIPLVKLKKIGMSFGMVVPWQSSKEESKNVPNPHASCSRYSGRVG